MSFSGREHRSSNVTKAIRCRYRAVNAIRGKIILENYEKINKEEAKKGANKPVFDRHLDLFLACSGSRKL